MLRGKRQRPNGSLSRSPAHIQRQPTRRGLHNNLLYSRLVHLWFFNGLLCDQSRTITLDEMFGADAGEEM